MTRVCKKCFTKLEVCLGFSHLRVNDRVAVETVKLASIRNKCNVDTYNIMQQN